MIFTAGSSRSGQDGEPAAQSNSSLRARRSAAGFSQRHRNQVSGHKFGTDLEVSRRRETAPRGLIYSRLHSRVGGAKVHQAKTIRNTPAGRATQHRQFCRRGLGTGGHLTGWVCTGCCGVEALFRGSCLAPSGAVTGRKQRSFQLVGRGVFCGCTVSLSQAQCTRGHRAALYHHHWWCDLFLFREEHPGPVASCGLVFTPSHRISVSRYPVPRLSQASPRNPCSGERQAQGVSSE